MKSSAFAPAAALLACTVLFAVAFADPEAPTATQATPAASTTATATATQAAAPAAPATATPPAAAAAPAATASTGGANLTSEQLEKHFKAEGYQLKMQHGQKYYCRNDTGTGSHIPHEQCYPEDALARAESRNPSSASMGTNGRMAPPANPKAGN